MATKLVLFLVLLGAIDISLAAISIEYAPATPAMQADGYSCFKTELGPMTNGQVNNNYSQEVCGRVTCNNGYLTFETCSPYAVPDGTPIIPEDPTKPFPACCNYPF